MQSLHVKLHIWITVNALSFPPTEGSESLFLLAVKKAGMQGEEEAKKKKKKDAISVQELKWKFGKQR